MSMAANQHLSSMDTGTFMSHDSVPDGNCPGCRGHAGNRGNTDKHYLTEKLMGKIGERLPGEWEKLGIYLGVSRVNLDRIRGDNRNKVEAWALDMFRMWYSRNSTHPSRWQDLQRALGEVYRNDLIDFTREYFLQNGIDPFKPTDEQIQVYFIRMAEKVPREWRDIGIYLLLPTDALDRIRLGTAEVQRQNREQQVLQAWCNGEKNLNEGQMFRKLFEVLKMMGRLDVTKFIEDEVNTYMRRCDTRFRDCFLRDLRGEPLERPSIVAQNQPTIEPPSNSSSRTQTPTTPSPGGMGSHSLHHPSDQQPSGQPNNHMLSASIIGISSQVDPSLQSHHSLNLSVDSVHSGGSQPSGDGRILQTSIEGGFQTDGSESLGQRNSLPSVTQRMENLSVQLEISVPVNTMSSDATADLSDAASLAYPDNSTNMNRS